jgi:hypothetical protein
MKHQKSKGLVLLQQLEKGNNNFLDLLARVRHETHNDFGRRRQSAEDVTLDSIIARSKWHNQSQSMYVLQSTFAAHKAKRNNQNQLLKHNLRNLKE